jgi:hypothetical protein
LATPASSRLHKINAEKNFLFILVSFVIVYARIVKNTLQIGEFTMTGAAAAKHRFGMESARRFLHQA